VLVLRARGAGLLGWELIAPLGFGGIGSGLVIAPNVSLVLEHVPWQDAGAASGILNTAQRVGQALGVAIVGAALSSELARQSAGSPAAHYSQATQVASLYSLGLVVVALALVFVIPKRSASSTGTW
jgi:hypothetical protein